MALDVNALAASITWASRILDAERNARSHCLALRRAELGRASFFWQPPEYSAYEMSMPALFQERFASGTRSIFHRFGERFTLTRDFQVRVGYQ
jgi:hypothetical protein